MIEIESKAWEIMVQHAEQTYPDECCGVMFGSTLADRRLVTEALPLANAWSGAQGDRYQVRNEDLLAADQTARAQSRELLGIFHSHPDCEAYFSGTDLQNSCPWYSFVVISVQKGTVHHANSFVPDLDQTKAEKEELICPKF